MTNLRKASEKLREHFVGVGSSSARQYHLLPAQRATEFKSMMQHKTVPVSQQLDAVQAERIAKNRLVLSSFVESVIFCGRQGIALRGHRDDWKRMSDSPHANHGNFAALLAFRADSGDKVLANHLQSASQHQSALYTSKTIQNELIDVCGDFMRSSILKEIRQAKFFAVMADEATDFANTEQLALALRFVKQEKKEVAVHGLQQVFNWCHR